MDKTNAFIEKARKIHGNKYDYSKVTYTNNHTRVCIICSIHGEFWQLPSVHLRGGGCSKCVNRGLSNEEKIGNAKQVHGGKYIYDKSDFRNVKLPTIITCPEHGDWHASYDNHVNGKTKCPKCFGVIDRDSFISKAASIHNNLYDYSKVIYVNSHTYIDIICNRCGKTFQQTPNAHLQGKGCNACASKSKLEDELRKELVDNSIEFQEQYRFEDWKVAPYDFYIAKCNLLIECQGKQHFGYGGWSKSYDFEKQKETDVKKYKFAKEKGKNIIYFTNCKNIGNYFGEIYFSPKDIANKANYLLLNEKGGV